MAETEKVRLPEELRIDLAAKRYIGSERNGNVERLLALNPGLAAWGGFVPDGYVLTVPRPDPAPKIVPSVNPWE